jgi:hypothetical protein
VSSASALRQAGREADEGELRAGVVRLGALLGWDASVVARFAEAVTGRDWSSCRREELLDVLTTYGALAHRVRAAQARLPGASGASGASGGARTAECGVQSECGTRAHDDVDW